MICFDKATFESKPIVLNGDTLFCSKYICSWFDYSLFDENDILWSYDFFYPEYSRYRAIFDNKDYIVTRGKNFIKYEIITE